MGPCQGRICGSLVSTVTARERRVPIAEIGAFRPRAPYQPITLGALAAVEVGPNQREDDAQDFVA